MTGDRGRVKGAINVPYIAYFKIRLGAVLSSFSCAALHNVRTCCGA